MVVINALVYKSRKDKCYVAEGYEIPQIGTGDTKEEAKKDLIKAIRGIRDLTIERGDLALLDAAHASRACEAKLQKIILSEKDTKPDIKKTGNIEIHFY